MKKIENKYLFFIVLIGFVLRFILLGEVPAGFHTDEAYFGYNAYSILKTGSEITGTILPAHLKSFLFSPAGYSYFSIPFIAIFGLSEFSTRFASAFFGSITILFTFLLAKKLLNNKKSNSIALLSALFLAISPWHINLSRVSTENVIVVFFVSLGTWLYLLWRDKAKLSLLLLSFLSFFITLFTYQASRSFLPIFIPLLIILFVSNFNRTNIKKVIFPFLLYLMLIVIPVLLILTSNDLSFRLRTLSIFQNPKTQLVLDEQLREDGVANVPSLMARVFHNKAINYSLTFLQNYSDHFSYSFLLTDSGLPQRYRIPGMGLLYFLDVPLLILGLWYLFNKHKKIGLFLLGWILVAPVGSALTFDDVPNLQRTLIIFPALPIVTGAGFYYFTVLIKSLKDKTISKLILLGVFLFAVYNVSYFLHSYFVHQKIHRPWYRQEGYKELVSVLNNYSKQYKKIVLTEAVGNPSIFIFFFNKYDPSYVQKIIKNNTVEEQYGSVSFERYNITSDGCPLSESTDTDFKTGIITKKIIGEKGILYVNDGQCKTPSEGVDVIREIKRNDGTSVFKLLSVK